MWLFSHFQQGDIDHLLVNLRVDATMVKELMHIRWAGETGLVDAIEPMVAAYKEVRGLQVRILSLHLLHMQCFDAVSIGHYEEHKFCQEKSSSSCPYSVLLCAALSNSWWPWYVIVETLLVKLKMGVVAVVSTVVLWLESLGSRHLKAVFGKSWPSRDCFVLYLALLWP